MALALSIENLSKALAAWRLPAPITVVAHPPGHQHPLALLRYIPGDPLDLTAPDAQRLVGNLLGRVHRLLRDDADIDGLVDTVLPYLTEEQPMVFARYPWLCPLLLRAVAGVRAFEDTTPVTYGGIFGDALEVIYDEQISRVGVIDWGAASKGPLLFDLALVVAQFHRAGSEETEALVASYAAEAPVTVAEIGGLDRYIALLWARQAKYFAWRLVHRVTRGEPESAVVEQTLSTYRWKLEDQLDRYEEEHSQ